MKKSIHLLLAAGIILLASCTKETVKPSAKASGTYTGGYTITTPTDTTVSGTAVITASGDNAVNIALNNPGFLPGTTVNGVSATLDGNNVLLSYSGTSTTDGTIISILSPSVLEGNHLTLALVVYFSSGNQNVYFDGNK